MKPTVLLAFILLFPLTLLSGPWNTLFPQGLVDADGKEVPLERLNNKLVCLYFSAAWCGPCKSVTPRVTEFRERYKDHVEVILVSQDRSEAEQLKYMKDNQMNFAAVKWISMQEAGTNSIRSLCSKYNGWGIPTFVVLAPDGTTIDLDARGKIEQLPGKQIEFYSNYDFDAALKRVNESRAKQNKPALTAEEGEKQKQFLQAQFAGKVESFKKLESLSQSQTSLPAKPGWEELLADYYQWRKKQ